MVTFTGPGGVNPTVSDFGNGTYLVSYTLRASGTYSIQILFNGALLGGTSEFPLAISPAASFPGTTSPVGTVPSAPVASQLINFEVQVYDRFGNPVQIGGDSVLFFFFSFFFYFFSAPSQDCFLTPLERLLQLCRLRILGIPQQLLTSKMGATRCRSRPSARSVIISPSHSVDSPSPAAHLP